MSNTDSTIATINDYEHTIEELRRTRAELVLQIDTIVEVVDVLDQTNKTLWSTLAMQEDIIQTRDRELETLTATCARLTSENERLRVALQTGEQ